MADRLYQVSDLAGARRREFLDPAKRQSASLRDTDGSVLAMTTATRLAATSEASAAVTMIFAAEAILARTPRPKPVELGGLAWLADFDADDQREALAELRGAVVAAITTDDPQSLRDALHGWETTARVTRGGRRREALLAVPGYDEFVEVNRPAAANAV